VATYDSAESHFINPASLVLAPGFDFIVYNLESTSLDKSSSASTYGLSLVDNGPDIVFPGGFHYIKRIKKYSNTLTVDEELWALGVAGYINESMALGMGIYKKSQKIDTGGEHSSITGDIGFIWHDTSKKLSFGASYYNLHIKSDSSTPELLQSKAKLRLGVQYIWNDEMMYRWDMAQQLQANTRNLNEYNLGIGVLLASFIQLRMGYNINELSQNKRVSLGLGFEGPKLKLDYSYSKGVEGAEEPMHGVDFRISF